MGVAHTDEAGTRVSAAGSGNPRMKGRRHVRRVAASFLLTLVLLVLDQVTKQLAQHFLSDTQDVPVLGSLLSLRLLRTPGASLGLGASRTWVISLFAIAACCLLVWAVVRTDSTAWAMTAALALAGAGGNLIDRVVYSTGFLNGTVVDFLNYGWSIGNVADIYLTLSAVIAIILLLRSVPFTVVEQADDGSQTPPAAGMRADGDPAHDGNPGDGAPQGAGDTAGGTAPSAQAQQGEQR